MVAEEYNNQAGVYKVQTFGTTHSKDALAPRILGTMLRRAASAESSSTKNTICMDHYSAWSLAVWLDDGRFGPPEAVNGSPTSK